MSKKVKSSLSQWKDGEFVGVEDNQENNGLAWALEALSPMQKAIGGNQLFEWAQSMGAKAKEYQRQETELKKYWLYNETVKDLELLEQEKKDLQKEIEHIKKGFNKLYSHISNIDTSTNDIPTLKAYSLECDYSRPKINTLLLPVFNELFECSESDVIDILSENITTQITAKPNIKLVEIVYFFGLLKKEKIINTSQLANVLGKSKCMVWRNKPITAKQITDATNDLKKGNPTHYILQLTKHLRKDKY